MTVSRGLIISLGVSALSCTILFLYFRNKITSIERKVDVMFDLIQNHESQRQNTSYNVPVPQYNSGPGQNVTREVSRERENDLIDVSDDDLSDDSREVSDDEEYYSDHEDSKISLDNTETIPLNDNDIKKIVVPMVSENITLEENPLEDVTDSLDEIDDDDEEEEIHYNKQTIDLNSEIIQVIKQEQVVSVEDIVEDLDDNNEQNIEVDEVDELDDDLEEEEEMDYNKLKVSELKALAKEKGLTNYKSLKKTPLVELLKSSE